MARVIDDAGATAAILKPLALPVFEPNALPDPTDRARTLIIINDRHNNELVPRLAISTGADQGHAPCRLRLVAHIR